MDNQFNDDELQKAIDDITKEATAENQPVFEPAPQPTVPPVAEMGAPAMDNGQGFGAPVPENAPAAEPATEPVVPAESAAALENATANLGANMPEPVQTEPTAPVEAPAPAETFETVVEPALGDTGGFEKTREGALRELFPLMDKINVNPTQKFDIYKEMFELMKSEDAADKMLAAAKDIPEDQIRADALMGLIGAIDELKK